MKKHILVPVVMLVSCSSVYGWLDDFQKIHERMDRAFEEISSKMKKRSSFEQQYDVVVSDLSDSIELRLAVAESTQVEDIAVEVDNGVFEAFIHSGVDTIELTVSGQRLSVSIERRIEYDEKNHDTKEQKFGTSISRSVQSQRLPARIDLSVAPQADLTDGVLTLTLAKHKAHKIQVTSGAFVANQNNKAEESVGEKPVESDDVILEFNDDLK